MIAPLAEASLLVPALVGVGVGVALERAGLGSAPKLAGQFTLRDLTVFKVMFTAIVTAMLGAFWLARLGWLDLARVHAPQTFVVPQLVGGLVFGAGFALAGLCPGTACVSAATGRGDGLATALGFLAGVLATGALLPRAWGFYQSTPRGALLLPDVLGVSYGVAVLVVVTVALAGFAAAGWWERRA
jgi:uncharacterized membrane protein YedE/YeeE